MKVFGIGLNKTGTKTLGHCFSLLGYNNKSFDLDLLRKYAAGRLDEIFTVCDQFDSFEDWPWPLLYRELDARYPDARFILTLRKDQGTWFESLCRHAILTGPTEARKIAYGYFMPLENREHHIGVYIRHNQSVLDYFNDRPGKLLVVSWEDGSDWSDLCPFLGCESAPLFPFPHKNKSMGK